MAFEDLETFTETDVGGYLTVTSARCTFTEQIRNTDSRIQNDYGVDHFGDFIIEFTLNFTGNEAGDATTNNQGLGLTVTTLNGDFITMWGGSLLSLYFRQDGANDDKITFILQSRTGGVTTSDIGDVENPGTWYVTFERDGAVLTMDFYTDESKENLDFGLTCACHEIALRYLSIAVSRDAASDPNDHISGYIENVDLNEVAPVAGLGVKTGLVLTL